MLRALIIKNLSLLVMLLGAGIVFSSTIVAKQLLPEFDFYYWTLFLTVIAIVSPCCLLGGEQLFIRYGKSSEYTYEVQFDVIKIMVTLALVSTVASFFVFSSALTINLGREAAFLAFFFSIITILYNLFRVSAYFVLAQVITNLWKLALLPIALVFYCFDYHDIANLFLISIGASTAVVLYLYKRHLVKIVLVNKKLAKSELFYLVLGSALTLVTLTLLANFDRFLMERYSNATIFSDYVYLLMLLVFPFNILSAYIGFKEVAFVKQQYNKEKFIKRMIGYATLLTSLFTVWYGLIYFLQELIQITLNYQVFLLCAALVFVKSAYAMCSAVFGIKGKPGQIILANVISLLILGLVLLCLFFDHTEVTVIVALLVTTLVFFFRYLIFFTFTIKVASDN